MQQCLTTMWIRAAVFVTLSLAGLETQAARTKHIILFIGDGMHLAHEVAGSRYLTGRDDGLSFHAFPFQAYASTWDVTTYNAFASVRQPPAEKYGPTVFDPLIGYDPRRGGSQPYPREQTVPPLTLSNYFLTKIKGSYPATDSASSATALATGFKTDGANISWAPGDPPDGALTTLAERLRQSRNARIGIVSTVPFSHATPAAHVSHNLSRGNYHAIAQAIARRFQPEVVISGGLPHGTNYVFISQTDYEWLRGPQQRDYVLVERQPGRDGREALAAGARQAQQSGRKLFALFGSKEGHWDFHKPQPQPGNPQIVRGSEENPLLKDGVQTALEFLTRSGKPTFLVVEQGDIDWANHQNDFHSMVGGIWDLHEAVRAAVDFVNRPGDGMDWENTLLIVTADHGNSYTRLPRPMGQGMLPQQVWVDRNKNQKVDGGEWDYPGEEVTYGSTSHTSELVSLYAKGQAAALFQKYAGGPLSWYPGTQIVDNTQIFRVMAEATGLLRARVEAD